MLNILTHVRKPRKRIGREKEKERLREKEGGESRAVTANVISGEKCGA